MQMSKPTDADRARFAELVPDGGLAGRLEDCWAPLMPLHRWLVEHAQDPAGESQPG